MQGESAPEAAAGVPHENEQFRVFVEQSPAAIAMFDTQMVYLMASRRWISNFRLGEREIIGHSHYEIFPEIPQRWKEVHQRALAGAVEVCKEEVFYREDGSVYWVRWEVQPWRSREGQIGGIIIFSEDITASKLADGAIRESEERLRILGDSLPNSYIFQCIYDAPGNLKFTYLSAGAEALHGVPAANILKDVDVLRRQIDPEQSADFRQMLTECCNNLTDFNYGLHFLHPDGGWRWLSIRARPRLRRDQRVLWDGIATDITESKRVEQALVLFRALIDHASDPIYVVDLTSARFLDFNEAATRCLGYTRAELLELSVFDVTVNVGTADYSETNNEAKSKGHTSFEVLHRRKDGSVFPVEVNKSLVKLDREYIIASVRDISDRKRNQEEHARLAKAIEQAAECVVITNEEAKITYVNPAFERITGYGRQEVMGRDPKLLKSGLHEDEHYHQMWRTLAQMQVWTGRITNRRKDGRLYTADVTISPVLDEEKRLVSYVAVQRDITDHLELERRLRQSQKLEAVGTLAGGIAHDFNNMLASILGYSELLSGDLPPDSPMQQDVGALIEATMRASDLVRQILTFSRQVEEKKQIVELRSIVKEALKLLRPTIPTSIQIDVQIHETGLNIHADPTQIHQVLVNLCTNAYYAMRDTGGRMTVGVEAISLDSFTAESYPTLTPGEYVRLSVRDTGFGIDRETQDRIFDPFFTTKPLGEGTGLGLATVHGIVTSHGGAITVYSNPGEGAVFHVYLPRVQQEKTRAALRKSMELGRSERLLVVDDEPGLLQLLKRALERAGYRVVAAHDSIEAIELLKEYDGQFDLLITDQAMPGGTGLELALEVRNLYPALPVIMMTGNPEVLNAAQLEKAQVLRVIQKPAALEVVCTAIRAVLNKE